MNQYKTLTEAIADLQMRGYRENFETISFCLYCGDLDMRLDPIDFRVDEEYRFDGDPNHQEDAIVVAITTSNGVKGMLVDSYDNYVENKNLEIKRVNEKK